MLARYPWLAPYLACVLFAIMGCSVRLLSDLPTSQVMFFRSLLPIFVFLPWICSDRASLGQAWQARKALVGRGLIGSAALYFYLVSVRSIPLADATVATSTSPIWAALAAWLALGERVHPRVLWAFPLSFWGVALVAGCRAEGSLSGYFAGLMSAALSGFAYALVRKLRQLPPHWVVLAFTGLATLTSAPLAYLHYQEPSAWQWFLILLMGLSGAGGQWFMTAGYRHNQAATAASLGLATVAITALLAWTLLGEPLQGGQWLGVALVLLSTAWISRSS